MPKRSHVPGTLYLICTAENPYKWAKHYLGWTERPDILPRLTEHLTGKPACERNGADPTGSPLVGMMCRQLGIKTPQELRQLVVAIWPGYDRCTERKLKINGSKARICPVCRARRGLGPYTPTRCEELKMKYIVGRVDGGMRKRIFGSTEEASRYIGTTIAKRDPAGVEDGQYYIDPVNG